MAKRAAEAPPEGQPASKAGNPFAGISLLSAGGSNGTLFGGAPGGGGGGRGLFSSFAASAASSSATASGFGGGFGGGSSSSSIGGLGFGSGASGSASAASFGALGFGSAPTSSGGLSSAAMASGGGTGCFFASSSASTPASAAPGGGNPFMGLSLFSSSPLAGAGSNGGIFTAAAASCIAGAGDESAGASSAPPASPEEPAPEDPTGKSAAPSPAGEDSAGGEEAAGATQDSLDANTGEEDEEVIFRGECKLWKLVRESEKQRGEEAADAPGADAAAGGSTPSATSASVEGKGWRWQERGCGIVHVNRHQQTGAGRLVMRMRGVLKLLLNTPVFPTTKYERLGQKSVRFVGVDVDDEGAAFVKAADAKEVKMCAYRMSLQGTEKQDEFLSVLRGTLNVASAM